jgi:hypothetical protein
VIVSRRKILQSTLALPFCSVAQSGGCILAEDHCLAAESAAGFRKVVDPNRHIVVVAASRNLTAELARLLDRHAAEGALVLFEIAPDQSGEQARRLAAQFQLRAGVSYATHKHAWEGEYVEYLHPVRRLVRPFLSALPLDLPNARVIARLNGTPTAVIVPFGRGNVVFFGSLLGPALYAGDREAHDVITALIKNKTSAQIESRVDRSDRLEW